MALFLVSTPIGNLGDLSPRAARSLRDADFWIVEDTRVSGKLQSHLDLRKPMRVLNDHSSPASVAALFGRLKQGESACLLTDAGTPVVSDPGADLVNRCIDAGVGVDVVPGPSAVTAALALSGFYGQRFCFLGFPPRKPGPLRELLRPFADSTLTLVLFEAPTRLESVLEAAADALGDRRYAICREISKANQQTYRARLPIIPDDAHVPRKGEMTVVIEGRRR